MHDLGGRRDGCMHDRIETQDMLLAVHQYSSWFDRALLASGGRALVCSSCMKPVPVSPSALARTRRLASMQRTLDLRHARVTRSPKQLTATHISDARKGFGVSVIHTHSMDRHSRTG